MPVDLSALSHDDLYELATRLQIKRRSKMGEEELREACKAALAERGEPEALDPEAKALAEAEEAAASAPAEAAPEPEISLDNLRKIRAASVEGLEVLLADPSLPGFIRRAIEAEVRERQAQTERKRQELAARSPMVRFRVTKGGRYVSKDGFPTWLSEGVLVTPLTHDLKHVAAQGIEWEEISGVGVGQGQLGEQVSQVEK